MSDKSSLAAKTTKGDLTAMQKSLKDARATQKGLETSYAPQAISDIPRELGLEKLRVEREQRKKALLNPEEYFEERDLAYQTMENRIQDTYFKTYNQYTASGYDPVEAKNKALNVAKTVRDAEEDVIKTKYSNDSSLIALNKAELRASAKRLNNP